MPRTLRLPYFDILLDQIAQGKRDITTAFGRHIHWGYWDASSPADGTMSDFARAAERMSHRVTEAAGVRNGQRILDVGCGFGGTVAGLDERLDDVELFGLNIDPRQIERARTTINPRPRNVVSFVEGDACEMPFDDASFDVVLALECAFHFPSRARFFEEAARVLRPGGSLAICDIVPSERGVALLAMKDLLFSGYVERMVGHTDLSCTVAGYRALARAAGLTVRVDEDVTSNTLPTYPILRDVARQTGVHTLTALWGTGGMQVLSRLGLLRYVILSFDKPRAAAPAIVLEEPAVDAA